MHSRREYCVLRRQWPPPYDESQFICEKVNAVALILKKHFLTDIWKGSIILYGYPRDILVFGGLAAFDLPD